MMVTKDAPKPLEILQMVSTEDWRQLRKDVAVLKSNSNLFAQGLLRLDERARSASNAQVHQRNWLRVLEADWEDCNTRIVKLQKQVRRQRVGLFLTVTALTLITCILGCI